MAGGVVSYREIVEKGRGDKKTLQRNMRTMNLYASIFRDVSAILKVLLSSDKALTVSQHAKSIMYSLIELKMGKRPDKF
jgi:hypothetical protein